MLPLELLNSGASFLTAAGSAVQQKASTLSLSDLELWSQQLGAWAFPVAILGFVLSCRRWRQDQAQHHRWEEAMARLDKMLEFDPQNAMAYWVKGELFEFRGHYAEALRCYRMAHRLCPAAYRYGEWRDASRRMEAYMEGRTPPAPLPSSHHWLAYSRSL